MGGTRVKGLFHQLKQDHHSTIVGELLALQQLTFDCLHANLSAGKCYSVEGAGTGACVFVHYLLGPFQ